MAKLPILGQQIPITAPRPCENVFDTTINRDLTLQYAEKISHRIASERMFDDVDEECLPHTSVSFCELNEILSEYTIQCLLPMIDKLISVRFGGSAVNKEMVAEMIRKSTEGIRNEMLGRLYKPETPQLQKVEKPKSQESPLLGQTEIFL